jgi:hypothetical protein
VRHRDRDAPGEQPEEGKERARPHCTVTAFDTEDDDFDSAASAL